MGQYSGRSTLHTYHEMYRIVHFSEIHISICMKIYRVGYFDIGNSVNEIAE